VGVTSRHEHSLLVVTESASSWGAEASLLELLKGLPSTWRATVLVAANSPLLAIEPPARVTIEAYGFASHPALRSGSFRSSTTRERVEEALSLLKGAIRACRLTRRHDVVLGFSLWQCPEFLMGARLSRTPFVLDLHDDFSGGVVNRIVRAMAAASAAVIAPSQHVFMRYGLTTGGRIHVVPRPVPAAGAPVRARPRDPSRPLRVGMFGQIAPHKGVVDLISAAESLPKGLVELTVVGGTSPSSRSEYEAECAGRIAALGDGSRLLPRVPDIEQYARWCDVIVNLSHQEAFGRSIVEALAHGALPLVLDGSGPAEIIRDTGHGVVLGSSAELAEMLARLAQGSELRTAPPDPASMLMRYAPDRATAAYWTIATRAANS
jgi:glycosyltransferase involved in cell wall biosynthesis